jgi:hypothetical protein
VALIPLAYLWEARPLLWRRNRVSGSAGLEAPERWSPLQQFGRSSLFVYWIHVEMVYGLISLPIHKSLTHGGAWVAFGAFTLFMLMCVAAKDRYVSRRAGRHTGPPAPKLAVQPEVLHPQHVTLNG